MISSVSRSISGCTSATWSLQQMTLPSADNRSSILWILTLSGIELRRCWSSWSVVVVGTRRPFLLPAVRRPMMRVPAIVAWQIGMTSWSSASKTLRQVSICLQPPKRGTVRARAPICAYL